MRASGRNTKRNPHAKTGMNFSVIFVIIILSIAAGYLTTKWVVFPWIGEKPSVNSATEENKEEKKIVEDDLTLQNEGVVKTDAETSMAEAVSFESGYSIQFGSFSTRQAAERLAAELKANGIETSVKEKDGAYKVLGHPFMTKEEALAAMESVNREIYGDIFITERNEQK